MSNRLYIPEARIDSDGNIYLPIDNLIGVNQITIQGRGYFDNTQIDSECVTYSSSSAKVILEKEIVNEL